MSRVASSLGEEVVPLARKRFSLLVIDTICAAQDNQCAGKDCLAILYPEPFDIDHITPLELGGSNDINNLQALCVDCHREKTRDDIKRIAKARRIRRKVAGLAKPKRPIPNRGFSKSLTRTFSGKVVPRV